MSSEHVRSLRELPLGALAVFEAVARHCNMVRAAAELGMTQSAVSRQIRALEDQLQEQLFVRGRRGLVLTETGDLLADYVSRGMGVLAAGLYRIGQPRNRTTVAVLAPRTFAHYVLAPRVDSFARRHGWVDLRVDSHRYTASLQRSDIDVAIRLGDGNWDDGVVMPLTRGERLFPVCAPGLLAGASSREPSEFLRGQTLLHYAERPHWPHWLRAAGLDPVLGAAGPRFGETALALAAAEAGQGIAIARGTLLQQAIVRGSLARPWEVSIEDGLEFFLVVTEHALRRSTVKAFVDWCRNELIGVEP